MTETHTLTFNYDSVGSGYEIRKGSSTGEYIHSPYTLQDGDVLYITATKISNAINGTSYSNSDLNGKALTFRGVDIDIVGAAGPQLGLDSPCVIMYYNK